MKKLNRLPILSLLAFVLASCSTYEYSARQVNVNRQSIDMNEKMVGVIANYSKQVTATSSFQLTKKDAIAEAEFLCLQNYKIDVIVDPIVKIEYRRFRIRRRFKATIIGFAGTYEELPNRLEESKKYTLEEIEKYKLLYDPSFPQYYYRNTNGGDTYYFNPEKKENKKIDWSTLFAIPKKSKK